MNELNAEEEVEEIEEWFNTLRWESMDKRTRVIMDTSTQQQQQRRASLDR